MRSAHWSTHFGFTSPYAGIVFNIVCWIVFSRVFDTSDPSRLPPITRNFLAIQPWWFAVGLLSVFAHVISAIRGEKIEWLRIYDPALMIASVIGMAWGIIAIFVLTLSFSDI